MILVYRTVSI